MQLSPEERKRIIERELKRAATSRRSRVRRRAMRVAALCVAAGAVIVLGWVAWQRWAGPFSGRQVEATAVPTGTATRAYPTSTAQPSVTPDSAVFYATARARGQEYAATMAAKTTTAVARANATAAIEAYRDSPPRGVWARTVQGISVGIGYIRYRSSGYGHRFVTFSVRVTNQTKSTIHVNPWNCTLVDLDGGSHSHDAETYGSDYALQGVDVPPGSYAEGSIVFRIRSDTGPARFIYSDSFGPTIDIDLRQPPDSLE